MLMTQHIDDLSMYEADAGEAEVLDENILAKITRVARELREAQADVGEAEATLKRAQERVRLLEERTLPDLMDEAGQKSLTTIDNYVLSRGETLRASIPPPMLGQACMWLNANGQGGIIKREMKLQFGKGEEQKAAEALDVLRDHHLVPTDKMSVHPMTLAATVRELLEAGIEVPMQMLGVYVQPFVKMKPVKP